MAMVFYLFDGKDNRSKLYMTACMLILVFYNFFASCGKQLILFCIGADATMPVLSRWTFLQIFSLGALPFIFLYDGTKGWSPRGKLPAKLFQYSFYAFYPVHQLILWIVRLFT